MSSQLALLSYILVRGLLLLAYKALNGLSSSLLSELLVESSVLLVGQLILPKHTMKHLYGLLI